MYKILNVISMDDYELQKLKKSSASWEYATVEGTEIYVNDSYGGDGSITVKGNTSQATSILPEGYTQVEYIESTGTQYIDTQRKSTANSKFEMDYESTKETGVAFQSILGAQSSRKNRVYIIVGSETNNIQNQFPHDANDVLYMLNNGTFSSTSQSDLDVTLTANERTKIIFDIPNRSLSVGNYTSISSSTYELTNSDYNILLFNRNDTTTPNTNLATGKLYNFKWYENNELVMNLVPCKNSNNEIGLYDLVSNTFFANAGTGTFTAGDVVTIPNPDYPQEIKKVTGNNKIICTNKEFELDLGQLELCKIGDYKDVLFKNEQSSKYYNPSLIENAWYKLQRVQKLLSNGSETSWSVNATYDDAILYSRNLPNNVQKIDGLYNIIANNLPANGNNGKYSILGQTVGKHIQIRLSKTYATNETEFKQWLSKNNVYSYYPLVTPTYIQITDETLIAQLEALHKFRTAHGVNHIWTEAEELEPNLEFTYKKVIQ